MIEGSKVEVWSLKDTDLPSETNATGVLRVLSANHPMQIALKEVVPKLAVEQP